MKANRLMYPLYPHQHFLIITPLKEWRLGPNHMQLQQQQQQLRLSCMAKTASKFLDRSPTPQALLGLPTRLAGNRASQLCGQACRCKR